VHGNLWVTDAKNAHVIELSSTGKVLQDWRLTGTARIFGITVDRAGNVYVTSGTEPHVLVFSPSGKMITSWGTTGTRPGQFRDPSGIVVSRDGTILVVDTDNNRIEKFSRIG
jgi:DNA-binding beta-propeller fold protein YncE